MALVLRETKGSPLTFEEMDDNLTYLEGRGFPFIGAATIDGTLNIDFTDTLEFYSGSDLELEGDPVSQSVTKGDMIGTLYREGDDELFSGVVDGVSEVGGGFAEIGIKVHTTGFKDIDTGDFVVVNIGKLVFPAELGGGEQIFISPMQAVFVESDDSFTEYTLRVSREIGTDDTQMQFGKFTDDGDFQSVYLTMDGDNTAMQFKNNLVDNVASVYRFEDNNDDVLFDIRNNGLFVGPNIPTTDPLVAGQIWLDVDTLKVSAGTP
jgi:hypothetical protein